MREPSGQLTRLFYDEDGIVFALERGGQRYGVGSDQVGTPRVVTDSSGAVVKAIDYDAFGTVLSDSNPAFSLPIGSGGGIADPLTGIVHFGFRDYDPRSGRFTARDALLFEGSPLNLYAYAGNNPIGYRDPTGLLCIGGSFFEGLGGGGSLCIDSGGISACAEVGVGVGGGLDVDPFGSHEDSGVSAGASASAGCGGVSVGANVSVPLGPCGGSPSWGAGGGGGPFSVGYGSDGPSVSAGGSWGDLNQPVNKGSFSPSSKCGVEASATIKGCVGTDW